MGTPDDATAGADNAFSEISEPYQLNFSESTSAEPASL
jgi:hypothetical protein